METKARDFKMPYSPISNDYADFTNHNDTNETLFQLMLDLDFDGYVYETDGKVVVATEF